MLHIQFIVTLHKYETLASFLCLGVEVSLWSSYYVVPEYIGAAHVCVHLLGQLETRVTVVFHTLDGTAVGKLCKRIIINFV